jgi:outer membrane protein
VTFASRRSIAIFALALALSLSSADALAQEPTRMSMEEAVRLSLDRNPTFLVAREEIRRAEALVEEARSQSLPTLYGAATYIRLDSDRTLDGTVIEPKSQVNLSALLTVPLVNPVAWATWSHAKDQVGVSKASALDTRRIVAVAAGHAYLAVFAQKRVLEADVRARDTAKAHFDYAHSRYSGGVGNRLDEVRAAQQLSTDETLVQSSRASVVRAQEALSVLLGVDEPVDSAEEPTLPGAPALPAAIDEATKTRSDVVVAEQRKEAAEHVKRDNWTQYSPYATATFMPFY